MRTLRLVLPEGPWQGYRQFHSPPPPALPLRLLGVLAENLLLDAFADDFENLRGEKTIALGLKEDSSFKAGS